MECEDSTEEQAVLEGSPDAEANEGESQEVVQQV